MRLQKLSLVALSAVVALSSCKKDVDPVIIVPPSTGSTVEFSGLVGAESGSSAGNSVYLDLSSNTMTAIARSSWELGFYSGSDFKVILNNTNGVSVVAVSKTDINTVTEADVKLDTLKLGQGNGSYAIIDDSREPNILNKTAIAEISATDANNKVYVLNAIGGTTGKILPVDSLFKIRILRKGTGYTMQYAKLKETTFKTLDVAKNVDFNFQFVSLFKETIVNVEPQKTSWDFVWTWSVYQFGAIPYSFSDMIFINNIAGVNAFERVYTDAAVALAAYNSFNKDSVAKYTFSSKRDLIGSSWRSTQPATGARTDRFYVIKDANGNYYKLKCLSMGVGADGGTRGKPKFEYALIP